MPVGDAFDVSTNEFYMKDKLAGAANIESLVDGMSSAEEMRQFVLGRRQCLGSGVQTSLYKSECHARLENRALLTHKIEIVLDQEVASMELLQELAAAVGVQVGSKEVGGNGSAWLLGTCGGTAVKQREILSAHESVVRARPIVTIPLVKDSASRTKRSILQCHRPSTTSTRIAST